MLTDQLAFLSVITAATATRYRITGHTACVQEDTEGVFAGGDVVMVPVGGTGRGADHTARPVLGHLFQVTLAVLPGVDAAFLRRPGIAVAFATETDKNGAGAGGVRFGVAAA